MAQTDPALNGVKNPLRLTWVGLWAEVLTHAFWPLWTVCLLALTALGFGALNVLPLEMAWFSLLVFATAIAFGIWYGARHFYWPVQAQAVARLDATLHGQPLAALQDAQAVNADDPQSAAVWRAHQSRMQDRLIGARAVSPDLRLSSADPFALRYIAFLGASLALIFGSMDRITTITPLSPNAAISGPTWEAWATPPAYTGKPALYLNEQPAGELTLPEGTRLQTRLYGAAGDMLLDETVSGRTDPGAASEPAADFTVTQSGELEISGAGGRAWSVIAIPDTPPTVTSDADIAREADGRFKQEFSAADDYGITQGDVTITLDMSRLDRRYGLALDPDPIAPVILDLPLPRKGDRSALSATLIDDLSQSILSNMPVTMIYRVTDAAGQTGQSDPIAVILPGRRFFDPLAAALIETRRDLLWARASAPRAAQILKAVTHAPDGFIRNQAAYLRLRVAIRRLDASATDLSPALRDEIAAELWEIALMVEEGDLQSAKERLERAQDRLDEAIRNGASQAEIQDLMAEMRDALQEYMRQLSNQAEQQGDQTSQNGPSMSQDQLQQMLDRLQELMEQGKTAEAADLMEQLRQFMDNMQIAQGQGGPSDQAMQDLGETLRGQQGLSDDAFRDLQGGQSGQGQDSEGGQSLAQRQQQLRDRLDQLGQNGALPGQGTEYGESGRQSLSDAGRAMEEAERALRDGDLSGALDRQAEALEALRNGIGDLNDALSEEQQQEGSDGGSQLSQDDPNGRDPLGRNTGNALRNGSDENLLQGDDVYRRADELLGEIRRRAGDQTRPETERSYLKRLLDLF
jgi:uncharacterized protein (TIGR02302 family)